MSINHGRIHIFVPQKLLNRPDVVTGFQQMGRKTGGKFLANIWYSALQHKSRVISTRLTKAALFLVSS